MEIVRICPEEHLLIKYYVVKHLILLKIQNRMDITVDLLQWFKKFLIKRLLANTSNGAIESKNISNLQLAKDLHKQIIRKLGKWKINSSFIDNIWGADLADMQLIGKFNKGFYFLLWVIDILCVGYSFER